MKLIALILLLLLATLAVAGKAPQHEATVIIHQLEESCHYVDTLEPGHVIVRLICHGDTILVAEVFEPFVDVPSRQLKQAVEKSDESLDELKRILDEYRKQQEAPPE